MTQVRHHVRIVVFNALLLGSASSEIRGQLLPNGPEFQVNQYTTSAQRASEVDFDSEGGFVVVWESFGSLGGDDSYRSVQARRYSSAGLPVGGEFQVNTYTPYHQFSPTVADDPQGGFVVAWASGADFTRFDSIRARRLDPDGTPIGEEIIVNSNSQVDNMAPSIGIDDLGNFVVTWFSNGSPGSDDDEWSIQARKFASDGTPLGAQFQVNQFTTGSQEYPAIAVETEGDFVIAWQSYGSFESDESGFSVQARRFTSDGSPVGSQFQVIVMTLSGQGRADVDVDPSGDFVVVWTSYESGGSDNDNGSIQARRFGSDGLPVEPESQVNVFTTGGQDWPSVRMSSDGGFVVAWTSNGSLGSDSDRWSIQARQFDVGGAALGGELQVNTYTPESQYHPRLAIGPHDDMAVVWSSRGSLGNDDQEASVQVRRFDGLFRDGFEAGHMGRWSTVVP